MRLDLPLVLLLHGNRGTVDDMADPAQHPGANYAWSAPLPSVVDRGWHGYPNAGAWDVGLDVTMPVSGWQPALRAKGFSTVNYGQADSAGRLVTAVLELRAVLDVLPADRPIAVVAHSRGGLLIRKVITDNSDNAKLLSRITRVITLHSPHSGSELAGRAAELAATLLALRAANPVVIPMTEWLLGQVNAPAYQEFKVGSRVPRGTCRS